MKGQHSLDDVFGQRVQVPLSGGQAGMAHHPLQVGQRHRRVTGRRSWAISAS
jgi:hypothetical protein